MTDQQQRLSPREMAAYHTMMLYREANGEALKALSADHEGPCCGCREQGERAREFLSMADEAGNAAAEIAGKR